MGIRYILLGLALWLLFTTIRRFIRQRKQQHKDQRGLLVDREQPRYQQAATHQDQHDEGDGQPLGRVEPGEVKKRREVPARRNRNPSNLAVRNIGKCIS